MTTKKEDVKAVTRDSAGLRDALFDELDALRDGRSNASKSNATAKLCSTVIETVRMEIDARKYLESIQGALPPNMSSLGAPLGLSHNK